MNEILEWKASCPKKRHAYFVKSVEDICQATEHYLLLVNEAEQVIHIYLYDKQIVVNAPRPFHFFRDAYSSKDVVTFVQHLLEFHYVSCGSSSLITGATYLLQKRLDPTSVKDNKVISSRL